MIYLILVMMIRSPCNLRCLHMMLICKTKKKDEMKIVFIHRRKQKNESTNCLWHLIKLSKKELYLGAKTPSRIQQTRITGFWSSIRWSISSTPHSRLFPYLDFPLEERRNNNLFWLPNVEHAHASVRRPFWFFWREVRISKSLGDEESRHWTIPSVYVLAKL